MVEAACKCRGLIESLSPKSTARKEWDLKFSLKERIAEKMKYIWWHIVEYIFESLLPSSS